MADRQKSHRHDRTPCFLLAELMNAYGTVRCDPKILQKISDCTEAGKIVDGHAPLLSAKDLNAPRDEQEARIYGMKRGLEFIANRQNTITEENLHHLYQISTGDYLPDEDRLLPNHFYRHGEVFIVGGEEPRPGLPAERLPSAMKCLVDFANANDGINELHKAAILHFAFAYYHPYFDGNGRTVRLFHLWYLVQQGYPAALFTPFSRYIAENKDAYYKAYERVERNARISGYTDVTPFLFYFCNEVYNRLQVDAVPPKTDLEVYQTALAEGKITEKERLLWEYVLSAYGAEEFTTKQLEKDFRNAAYATIRTFVMKFHEMGLLTARKAPAHGNCRSKAGAVLRSAPHRIHPDPWPAHRRAA